jgi:hypothetical protein
VGAIYLLSKDLMLFKDFLDKYYKTDVLPELPETYQEAIVILAEQEPAYFTEYDISETVIRRFDEFKSKILANRSNSAALPGLMKRSHGNTYWYYYMYK